MSARRALAVALLAATAFAVPVVAAPGTLTAAPTAAAASALPDLLPGDLGDCKADEPFTTPVDGPAAVVDTGPTTTPPAGDPFAAGSTTTVYEQYGFGGLTWVDYDPGCNPINATSKGALGTLAGLVLSTLVLATALTTAVSRWAFNPATLANLEPIQRVGAAAFGDGIFLPLAGLAITAVGILSLWRYTRAGAVSAAASTLMWTVLITGMAIAAATYPTQLAPAVDSAATGAVAEVSSRVAGDTDGNGSYADTLGGNLTRSVLYETWVAGNLGRSSGATAEQFGPRLLAASTVTRAELAATQDDPKALADLQERKAEEFADVAEDLKDADPTAYSYLAGNHNGERLGSALLGFLAMAATAVYPFMAAVYLLFALVVVRGAIIVTPLVALLAIFPGQRYRLFQVFQYVATCITAGVLLGFASALVVRVTGALLSPTTPIPWFLALLMIAVVCVAAWKFTKPFRHIKNLTKHMPRGKPRRRQPGQPGQPTADEQLAEEDSGFSDPDRSPSPYRHSTPAESRTRTYTRAALTGALQGAAAAAAAGVVTGGTATLGAAAAGAAKGAGTAAAGTALATSAPAATSSTGAPAAALPAPYTPPTAAPDAAASTSAPSSGYRPGDPLQARENAAGVWEVDDVYTPPTAGADTDADSTAGATR